MLLQAKEPFNFFRHDHFFFEYSWFRNAVHEHGKKNNHFVLIPESSLKSLSQLWLLRATDTKFWKCIQNMFAFSIYQSYRDLVRFLLFHLRPEIFNVERKPTNKVDSVTRDYDAKTVDGLILDSCFNSDRLNRPEKHVLNRGAKNTLTMT